MGRKRQHNKHLPRRVYMSRGKYYFVDTDQRWIPLGSTEPEMLENLARLNRSTLRLDTMNDVFDRLVDEVFPERAPRTREDYMDCLTNLRRAFGHMRPMSIKPKHIYAYMDARGRTAKVRANHEKAVLSLAMRHAVRWGLIERNPCREVRNFPVRPRDRCISDEEFAAVRSIMPPRLQAAMDIALLTGLRQGDILDLRYSDLKDDGIHVTHSKTKKRLIYEWTDALRAAIELARRERPKGIVCPFVISTQQGTRYTRDGFKAIWQRKMRQALADGLIRERFTFHDIRSMAADASKDPQRLLGHQNPATTRRIYLRKPDKVKPTK